MTHRIHLTNASCTSWFKLRSVSNCFPMQLCVITLEFWMQSKSYGFLKQIIHSDSSFPALTLITCCLTQAWYAVWATHAENLDISSRSSHVIPSCCQFWICFLFWPDILSFKNHYILHAQCIITTSIDNGGQPQGDS